MKPEATKPARPQDVLEYERRFWGRGHSVAGVDEVGRGPLAGPVVAAAVILPEGVLIEGADDSKVLGAEERLELFGRITAWAWARLRCGRSTAGTSSGRRRWRCSAR
jgi:hypothetical protein